eukprot:6183054-Pyramimonas_sp.AAC.1
MRREQKQRAKGPAWTAQSPGQIQAAKAIIEAVEGPEKKPRNQRNKKVIERSKEGSKALAEASRGTGANAQPS